MWPLQVIAMPFDPETMRGAVQLREYMYSTGTAEEFSSLFIQRVKSQMHISDWMEDKFKNKEGYE